MSFSWSPRALLSRITLGTCVLVVVSLTAGIGLSVGVPTLGRWLGITNPDAAPLPVIDARFTSLGHKYLPQLGQAYAKAWNEGAKSLEAGQPMSDALQTVSQVWKENRVHLFDQVISPELTKIVPEGRPEPEISLADRLALARAWRGIAAGLAK